MPSGEVHVPPIPQRDPNVAVRKIYFHKVLARSGDDGFALDRDALVAAIQGLEGTPQFYLPDGPPADEQYLCAVADRAGAPHRVRFYRVRRRNLPETEAGGTFEALELDERRGLAESIHIVLFDDDVIGSEYNHYGPRVSVFAAFLNERCGMDVRVRQLVRRDVMDAILAMREIRVMRIKVSPAAATVLQQRAPGLGGAFDAAELFSAGRYMDLTLAATRGEANFTDKVQSFLRTLRDAGVENQLDAAQVYGKTQDDAFETLDLLKDRIVLTREIERESPRSRALDKDAAYRAVEDAYGEIEEDLDAGGTITVEQ
jgi:hypothetical protein